MTEEQKETTEKDTTTKEAQQTDCNKKSCYMKYAALILLIAIALGLLFTRGGDMIAEPFVRAKLDNVAMNIKKQAALSGDKATLTYDDVKIGGGVFNKKATITNLTLDYKANLPFGNMRHFTISTPQAIVTADQIDENSVNIKFPEPFAIKKDDGSNWRLIFKETPTYAYSMHESIETHDLKLPDGFTLNLTPDNENPVELTASYNSGASFTREIDYATASHTSNISLYNISITSNVESNEIAIGTFKAHSKESRAEEMQREFKNSLMIGDVYITKLETKAGPYNVSAEINGDYSMTQAEQSDVPELENLHMNVEQFMFSTDSYKLDVKASLNRSPEDPMVYGAANIHIDGLGAFKQSPLIGVQDEALKDKVIKAVTGADANAETAGFILKREEHGTFYVGQTTFENLIGIIVTHSMAEKSKEAIPDEVEEELIQPAPERDLPAESATEAAEDTENTELETTE